MFGTHRGFPEYIGKGMRPLDLLAEYMGKKGLLDGKCGIQVSDKSLNIPPMASCLGGNYGPAVGIAYAIKLRRQDRLVALFYGDGAYNEYDAHAAMVIAASLGLPLLFIVRYNGWAQYTRAEEFNPTGSVAARGTAYNIEADAVDGNRVEVVYEAAKKAVEYVRSSQRPFIMEYKTFRIGPHWSGDAYFKSYMDRSEKKEWLEKDPIRLCKELLIERGALTEEDFQGLRVRVSRAVDELIDQVLKLPYPNRQDMFSGLLAGEGGCHA